jgi:hypothetical protein
VCGAVGHRLELGDNRGQPVGGGDEVAAQRVVERGGDDRVAPDLAVVQGGHDLRGDPALGVAAQRPVLPRVGDRRERPKPRARGEPAEQVSGVSERGAIPVRGDGRDVLLAEFRGNRDLGRGASPEGCVSPPYRARPVTR